MGDSDHLVNQMTKETSIHRIGRFPIEPFGTRLLT